MTGRRLEGDEVTVSPQALADLIGLVTEVAVPAGVVATWTPREREEASAWASAEHDNTGVERLPQPVLVARAVELSSNPAVAQLALENWVHVKEAVEGGCGRPETLAADALVIAQEAITGLLVLLEEKPPSWQQQAIQVLSQHPEGVRSIDLFALLGQAVPSQHALAEWLAAGKSMGVLTQVRAGVWDVWAVAGPDARRQRP